MPDRRSFLAGLVATGLCPKASWADVGSPRYLSAAKRPDGAYVLCGLSAEGAIVFEILLAGRGHAAAAHPTRPLAVAFARRPGTFAVVLDCTTGLETAQLSAPKGRHFYGHGTFSSDGGLLFTTENDYEAARGVIGVWDVQAGFQRIDEFPSGGIGPHDIKLLPDSRGLVVANGGIETHPETGRAKLNIPSMRPNLSIVDVNGHQTGICELDPEFRKNSIRHLAVNKAGDVAFAMQWQGDVSDHPPLLGKWSVEGHVDLLSPSTPQQRASMHGYAGSVAFSSDLTQVAITSPRGGRALVFDSESGELLFETVVPDACGIADHERGFVLTSGNGKICIYADRHPQRTTMHERAWDNHLVELAGAGSAGSA
ncbi:MAG: DUF1513 domain-containing protein [Dinoroseobacter sp.]|nr:DUF1513 domain-containing protein [Dinoroseobacter sp.]